MKDLTIKQRLVEKARLGGICLDGLKEMRVRAIDDLVDYYIENPDWCLERNFPDLQTLSESFAKYEYKGVYVNRAFHGEVFSHLQAYIFHNCKGYIKVAMDYENAVIPMLYFANGCDMTVDCDKSCLRHIVVPVYQSDEWANVVNLVQSDKCRFVRHEIKLIEP